MSDELQAAAQHILGFFQAAEEHPLTPLGRSAKKLAEAYIVEHPTDDGEPMDHWWYADIGKTSHIVKWSPVQLWIQFDDGSTHVIKDNPTRDDVHRLLVALGIKQA